MNDEVRKTMSVPEAGKHLGLGKNGAYAAAARGEIPVIKIGSRLRVPVVAFERMLAEVTANKAA
jgi:excisionase family DNA binding protein